MKQLIFYLALLTLLLAGAGCAPAETLPEPAVEPREPSPIPAETTPPLATISVRPTEANSPAPTPTPTKMVLEIVPETPTKPVAAEEIYPMPQDPTAVPPSDPYSLELIDKAKRDLAQRTSIPVEEIVLAEFRLVTWPNTSLGCPQPGMAYADVLVDGYLIMLRADLGIYNYHGGGDPASSPFLCEGIGTKIIVPPPARSDDT